MSIPPEGGGRAQHERRQKRKGYQEEGLIGLLPFH